MEHRTLDGRKFVSIMHDGRKFTDFLQTISARQEDYILGQLAACGATKILCDLDGVKRTDQKRFRDFGDCVLQGGRRFHVLAGCLTEIGKRWTEAEADRNAEIFGDITAEREKTFMDWCAGACLRVLLLMWREEELRDELREKIRNAEGTARANSRTGSGPQRVN